MAVIQEKQRPANQALSKQEDYGTFIISEYRSKTEHDQEFLRIIISHFIDVARQACKIVWENYLFMTIF